MSEQTTLPPLITFIDADGYEFKAPFPDKWPRAIEVPYITDKHVGPVRFEPAPDWDGSPRYVEVSRRPWPKPRLPEEVFDE